MKSLTISLFTLTLTLMILMSNSLDKISIKECSTDVCMSPKCIQASARILNNIDESIDPCQDFYNFACSKFMENTIIPQDKSSVNAFSLIRDKVEYQLKSLVENDLHENTSKPYKLVKKVYNMCMNSTEIETNALPTAKALILRLGGWPVLEGNNWNESDFNWISLMYKYRQLGIGTNFFISILVSPDLRNPSRNILTISDASLDLPRELLLNGINDPIIKTYYDYVVDLAILFGAAKEDALKEMNETLEFEIKLSRICISQDEQRNLTKLDNPMRIKDLQTSYPFVPWLEYITNIVNIPEIVITDQEIVGVDAPYYFDKLRTLLQETPKRVQANYMMRVLANNLVSTLGQQFRKRKLQFDAVLRGKTASQQRWQECLNIVLNTVRFPIEALYVRKYFNNESKAKVAEILENIRSEFHSRLETLQWIGETSKTNMREKIRAMKAVIGYPNELLKDGYLDNFYSELKLDSDNYLQTMVDCSIFYTNCHYSKLRTFVNETEWQQNAAASSVNAFYFSSENTISIPAGILQDAFFEEDSPQYLNYGAIGSTIGHELIHGFDDFGSQFDENGNLNDWWENATKDLFLNKSQCIMEQYGNYTVADLGINVNGQNTLGENIADLGGIIQSYLAYQEFVRRNGHELPLPALNFTSNQLFWISAAYIKCKVEKRESKLLSVTTGEHAPAVFRVNGVYRNIPYFADDFKCSLGTPMNPTHKCSVW